MTNEEFKEYLREVKTLSKALFNLADNVLEVTHQYGDDEKNEVILKSFIGTYMDEFNRTCEDWGIDIGYMTIKRILFEIKVKS